MKTDQLMDPFFWATQRNNSVIVDMLLAQTHININAQTSDMVPPILMAVLICDLMHSVIFWSLITRVLNVRTSYFRSWGVRYFFQRSIS